MAGQEEERAGREQLLGAQSIAGLLHRDERRQEIFARRPPPLRHEVLEVRAERVAGGPGPDDHVGIVEDDRVQAPGDVAGPLPEQLAVCRGHAHHLADDAHRQGIGEVRDQLHLAAAHHGVEQLVHHLLDPPAQGLDRARREGAAHERAQPGVVGWVLHEHGVSEPRPPEASGDHLLEPAAAEARVAQDERDVLVARQHPHAHRGLVHGVLGPQPVIERIRVLDDLGEEGVELDGLGRAHRTGNGARVG